MVRPSYNQMISGVIEKEMWGTLEVNDNIKKTG
ncbi:hypothetical protein J2Z80_000818 [Thermoanaerobacterium butyriciformans]|uniref:Uncharacterized protein n=1 Tax=Thermoanaerobacterium butyriciformans TaxID=1702242 RepID=A0ABS4NCA7_9THEO|nr:hypothetical protein [Thermoanaerobacterium butyriciformans]